MKVWIARVWLGMIFAALLVALVYRLHVAGVLIGTLVAVGTIAGLIGFFAMTVWSIETVARSGR